MKSFSIYLFILAIVFACATLQAYPRWGAEEIETVDSVCVSVAKLYPQELLDSAVWRDLCQAGRVKAKQSALYTGYDGPTYSPALVEVIRELLAAAGDPALRLLQYTPSDEPPDTLRGSRDLPLSEIGSQVCFGDLGNNLGYLCIESWQGGDSMVAAVDSALQELRFSNGLVLDLRAWRGGSCEQGYQVLGRFTEVKLRGVLLRHRIPGSDQTKDTCHTILPRGDWQYTKPVVMLAEGAWPAYALAEVSKPLQHVYVLSSSRPRPPRGVEPLAVRISREFTIQIPTAVLVREDGAIQPPPSLQTVHEFTPRCGDREDSQLWAAAERLQKLVLQARHQQRERMEEMFRNGK